jgi:tetratricopeptide (TPR) repeat protein
MKMHDARPPKNEPECSNSTRSPFSLPRLAIRRAGILFIAIGCAVQAAEAVGPGDLEVKLRGDIADRRLDDVSRVEAAFILSGCESRDTLDACLHWYQSVLQSIRDFHFDPFDRIGSAGNTFAYLHSTWLLDYEKESTSLLDIRGRKAFNCVSATILYNILCEDMGWSTEAFETPTHVYTIFTNFTQDVMVENTTPMGFDIIKNLQAYSRFLLQYYPQNQALQIGLDHVYAHENSRGRRIDNTELLGLLAYNRAYMAERRGDFAAAYDMVIFAQQFNGDSRSNIDFEIGLFGKWGEKLYQASQYDEALNVYLRGAERYPDITDFQSNARASFLRGLTASWKEKNWESSLRLGSQPPPDGMLNQNDIRNVIRLFQNWAAYLSETNRAAEAAEADRLYKTVWKELDESNP